MLVRGGGNFHENIREFHPIKPGHLVQDCPGLGSPALELQPGERLWDPPAQRERDEAVLLASLASLAPEDDGEDEEGSREGQLGPVAHQGGEEGGRDGGQAVADHEGHDGDCAVVEAAVLQGEETGEVRHGMMRTPGRQSQ